MTTKLDEVVVFAKVKAISLASVVVIVFPPLYADCKEKVAPPHFVTLFEASTQRVEPATPGVVRPLRTRYEVAEVLSVMLFPLLGVSVEAPFAVNGCPFTTVAPPLSVARPPTLSALLIVVVPEELAILTVVALPPMLSPVALVLNKVAVPVFVVVIFPPLTARFAPAVTFPVRVEVRSTVRAPFA